MISDNVRQQIITKLNLARLSKEEQGYILAALQENILTQINIDILERLTGAEVEEMNQLDSAEAIDAYLHSKIPNLPELIEKAAVAIVDEFKTLTTTR